MLFVGCTAKDEGSPETGADETVTPADYAGTYTGVAPAYNGELSVEVELDSAGKILSVTVDKNHGETQDIGTIPIESFPAKILSAQSLKVDAVTGATVTSDAILAAVADALSKAGLNPADYGFEASESEEYELAALDLSKLPEKAPVTGSIELTDSKGRQVTLDTPISSYAISTMDVIDYIIPLLGEDAFHKLVASGQDGGHGLNTYAKLYTPIIGNFMEHVGKISEHNAPFDLEMILAVNPDVLIVNSAMGAHNYALEIEPQLQEAGIPIVLIDVPGKIFVSSAQETIRQLGGIFQVEERAEEVASFIDEQFDLLASKNLAERNDKPTVYYEKSGY
ncbi:MAG: FMN-binding protein, partial [Clostridiales bacterium]|nr:FMN-binding protein [Clostridiales bacterium]